MSKTVLIGGGTGLIGWRLASLLHDRGDRPRILTREVKPGKFRFPRYVWDARAQTIDPDAMAGVTHVVNLAGAGIADARWTPRRKALIIESRTRTTALLAEAIACAASPIEAFVSAGAIGYYGDRGEELVDEDSGPGEGFLSESTILWERAVGELAGRTGVRTALLRTGIVLSPDGGALEKMLVPARLGISGYFGAGRQYYSWIHIDDIALAYLAALDDERFVGPINAVAPEPETCKTLAQVLAEALPNPCIAAPVPAFGLKLALGEMSHTVLDSTRVSAAKLELDLGFEFGHPTLRGALEDLVGGGD